MKVISIVINENQKEKSLYFYLLQSENGLGMATEKEQAVADEVEEAFSKIINLENIKEANWGKS